MCVLDMAEVQLAQGQHFDVQVKEIVLLTTSKFSYLLYLFNSAM